MKTKKVLGQIVPKTHRAQALLDHDQVMEVLRTLQQKVLASAALNGGFDTLMFKVERIEEGQSQMGAKVDSIHNAIYDPDDGLFARVKDVEHVKEKVEATEKLSSDVAKLQQWHESEEKIVEREARLSEEHEKLVQSHAEQLKELTFFKTRVCAIVKWGLVTVGGGVITGIGKILYDFLQGHITLH